MRIRLPATAYRGTIGAKEEETIWEILFQHISTVKHLNHANLLILSSWVAESLDKCVCPKQGTPKSSGLNCKFEGVDTIGMHTWSVYRQTSFDHLIMFFMFFVFDHSTNLKGLEAVHTLLRLAICLLAWAQAYSCSSARSPWLQKVMPLRHQQSAKMHLIQMSKVYCPKHQNPGKRPRAQAGLHNEVEVAMQDVFDTFQNEVFSRASA